jgi:hypothetical protein
MTKTEKRKILSFDEVDKIILPKFRFTHSREMPHGLPGLDFIVEILWSDTEKEPPEIETYKITTVKYSEYSGPPRREQIDAIRTDDPEKKEVSLIYSLNHIKPHRYPFGFKTIYDGFLKKKVDYPTDKKELEKAVAEIIKDRPKTKDGQRTTMHVFEEPRVHCNNIGEFYQKNYAPRNLTPCSGVRYCVCMCDGCQYVDGLKLRREKEQREKHARELRDRILTDAAEYTRLTGEDLLYQELSIQGESYSE